MKKKVIYIAGPMSGIPEFNFPAFNAVEFVMEADGHRVFNPARRDTERHGVDISKGNNHGCPKKAKAEHGFSLRVALKEDIEFICLEADTMVMLPGWENSYGARAEHTVAVALDREGINIEYLTREQLHLMLLAHRLHLETFTELEETDIV